MNGYYNNIRSTNGINQVSLNDTTLDYTDKILYTNSDGIVSAIDSTTDGFLKNTSASYAFSSLTIDDLGINLTNNSTMIYTGSICSSAFTASKLQDLNNNLNLTASTVEINNKSVIFKDITGSNLHLTIIPNGSNNGNAIYDLPYTGSYAHYFNDNLTTGGNLTATGVITGGNGLSVAVVSGYPNTKITTANQGSRGVINYGNISKTAGQMINFLSASNPTASNPCFQIFRADVDTSNGDGNLTILNKGLTNSMILNNDSDNSKIKIQNNSVDKLIVDKTNTTISNNLITASISASCVNTDKLYSNNIYTASISASCITTDKLYCNTFNLTTFNLNNITASSVVSDTLDCNILGAGSAILGHLYVNTASFYGNLNSGSGNINTDNGTITALNLQSNINITASSTITGYILQANYNITASNQITGKNILSASNINASNMITGLNLQSNNNITASGTITGLNIQSNNNITASNQITGLNLQSNNTITASTSISTPILKNGGNANITLTTGGQVKLYGLSSTANRKYFIVNDSNLELSSCPTTLYIDSSDNIISSTSISSSYNILKNSYYIYSNYASSTGGTTPWLHSSGFAPLQIAMEGTGYKTEYQNPQVLSVHNDTTYGDYLNFQVAAPTYMWQVNLFVRLNTNTSNDMKITWGECDTYNGAYTLKTSFRREQINSTSEGNISTSWVIKPSLQFVRFYVYYGGTTNVEGLCFSIVRVN